MVSHDQVNQHLLQTGFFPVFIPWRCSKGRHQERRIPEAAEEDQDHAADEDLDRAAGGSRIFSVTFPIDLTLDKAVSLHCHVQCNLPRSCSWRIFDRLVWQCVIAQAGRFVSFGQLRLRGGKWQTN
eukprot:g7921.t1